MKHVRSILCVVVAFPLVGHAKVASSSGRQTHRLSANGTHAMLGAAMSSPIRRVTLPAFNSRSLNSPIAAAFIANDGVADISPATGERRATAYRQTSRSSLYYSLLPGRMAASVGFVQLSNGDSGERRWEIPTRAFATQPSNRIFGGTVRLAF